MATFGGWLDDQAAPDLARTDTVGQLARAWLAAKGERPRVFAPESVSAWVLAHLPEAHHAAIRPAVAEWRAGRAGTVAPMADSPSPPSDPQQQPGQAAVEPASLPAIMASLGRIETRLAELTQGQLALLSWAGEQDKRIEPVVRLLGELGASMDEADAEEAEGARMEDGDSGPPPDPSQGGSLWRNIAAPEPDFAAMAADGRPDLIETATDDPYRAGGESPGG